jgi:glycosyltransferase involved in cell wall biosynthesis
MRILTISYEYPPVGGGGSVVAGELAPELASMGHTVDVVTSRMRGLDAVEEVQGVQVHRAACWRRYRHYTTMAELVTTLLPAYRRAAALIRAQRPDVVHAHFVFPSGLVAWLLARRYGLPYVLTAHGSDVPGYNPDRFQRSHVLLRPLWRRIVRGAAVVVAPSRYLATLIRARIEIDVRVIPNGHRTLADPDKTRCKRVLAVARLFPRKGIQHLIEAVRDLDSDWEFVIAGDGPYRSQLEALAAAARPRFHFVGFLDRETLKALYEQANILVFPSIRENCPMVLLEGMDAGCAVITSDAEGCAEVVANAGIVVAAGDAGAIRHALEALMADEARARALGRCAHERAQLFRWPRIAVRYAEVLREAAGVSLTDAVREEVG